MVCRTHKYADGGKVVKDHTMDTDYQYPKPSYLGAVKDRVKRMLPGGGTKSVKEKVKEEGDKLIQKAAPRSIVDRKRRIDQAVDEATE